jgi:hypothetical protein
VFQPEKLAAWVDLLLKRGGVSEPEEIVLGRCHDGSQEVVVSHRSRLVSNAIRAQMLPRMTTALQHAWVRAAPILKCVAQASEF